MIDYEGIIAEAWKDANALNAEGFPGSARSVYAACMAIHNLHQAMKTIDAKPKNGEMVSIVADRALRDCPNCSAEIGKVNNQRPKGRGFVPVILASKSAINGGVSTRNS